MDHARASRGDRLEVEIDAGDHRCMVGEVMDAGVKREVSLLTLEERGYRLRPK